MCCLCSESQYANKEWTPLSEVFCDIVFSCVHTDCVLTVHIVSPRPRADDGSEAAVGACAFRGPSEALLCPGQVARCRASHIRGCRRYHQANVAAIAWGWASSAPDPGEYGYVCVCVCVCVCDVTIFPTVFNSSVLCVALGKSHVSKQFYWRMVATIGAFWWWLPANSKHILSSVRSITCSCELARSLTLLLRRSIAWGCASCRVLLGSARWEKSGPHRQTHHSIRVFVETGDLRGKAIWRHHNRWNSWRQRPGHCCVTTKFRLKTLTDGSRAPTYGLSWRL